MVTVVSLMIAVLTAGFVFYPLFRTQTRVPAGVNETWEELLTRRDNLYTTIKDLEFDYLAGKLDEPDYHQLRAKYEAEAIQVLHQLDAWQSTQPVPETAESSQYLVEIEIEKYKQMRQYTRSAQSTG